MATHAAPPSTLTATQREAIEERRLEALRRRITSARRHAPYTFRVAGVNSYRQNCRMVMDTGRCDVALMREPNNQHDPNAIAVRVGGALIGYVPRRDINKVRQRMSPERKPKLAGIGTHRYGFYARLEL